jgi:hypothetical protein
MTIAFGTRTTVEVALLGCQATPPRLERHDDAVAVAEFTVGHGDPIASIRLASACIPIDTRMFWPVVDVKQVDEHVAMAGVLPVAVVPRPRGIEKLRRK